MFSREPADFRGLSFPRFMRLESWLVIMIASSVGVVGEQESQKQNQDLPS